MTNAAAVKKRRDRPRTARTPHAGLQMFFSKAVSPATKIDVIRRGVPPRVVHGLAEYLDVPMQILFGVLHIPESTAHRLIKDDRRLDSAASERVVRIAGIIRMAEDTFGGRDAATQWLKTANLGLGSVTPLSMLDTELGGGEVRRILSSIDHGGVF